VKLISKLGLRVVPAIVTNFVSLRNKYASSPDLGKAGKKQPILVQRREIFGGAVVISKRRHQHVCILHPFAKTKAKR
jgi:hypothetical protein